jgi:hypothetical protein
MCKSHWFALPKQIRSDVWATYKEGQEITKSPSPQYLQAAKAALDYARLVTKRSSTKPAELPEPLDSGQLEKPELPEQ